MDAHIFYKDVLENTIGRPWDFRDTGYITHLWMSTSIFMNVYRDNRGRPQFLGDKL